MKLSEKQMLFSRNVRRLLEYIQVECACDVTLGEVQRTREQQMIYVERGRSTTMDSQHLDKLAIDLNIFINGKYVVDKESLQHIGDYWESLHEANRWGGNWKLFQDTPHFEMRG